MKPFIVIALAALGITRAQAQKMSERDVPPGVRAGLTQAYPNTKGVKWEKENNNYEAEFTDNKKELSILLDVNGDVQEVETEISHSQLPKPAQDAVAKDYAGYKIKEISKIEAKGKTTFEVEVEKANQKWELLFQPDGALASKREITAGD